MAIVQTVNFSTFRDAFSDRFDGQYKNNFSIEGLEVLFAYLEEISTDMDDNLELDIVALCCEYEETTVSGMADYYSYDSSFPVQSEFEDVEEFNDAVESWLNDKTVVCGCFGEGENKSYVFASF